MVDTVMMDLYVVVGRDDHLHSQLKKTGDECSEWGGI